MEELKPIDLKTILHSKRINIYYLEHCRVQVSGGTVVYITDENKRSSYWNIPIANTTVVLLGTGTSVSQAAIREFSKAGVLVGFCGGGGTPLYAGCEIEFLNSQSEYRPTEYLQQWIPRCSSSSRAGPRGIRRWRFIRISTASGTTSPRSTGIRSSATDFTSRFPRRDGRRRAFRVRLRPVQRGGHAADVREVQDHHVLRAADDLPHADQGGHLQVRLQLPPSRDHRGRGAESGGVRPVRARDRAQDLRGLRTDRDDLRARQPSRRQAQAGLDGQADSGLRHRPRTRARQIYSPRLARPLRLPP